MGYDAERFVGRVKDGLLCCVCRDVLEDPLQAPCEHAFCSACIHGWLVHNHTCPEDRQPLDASELRPLFRYMRNDLNALRLHCTHRARGCEGVCALETIAIHEQQCPYTPTPCPHTGCGAVLDRQNVVAHAMSCQLGELSPDLSDYVGLEAGSPVTNPHKMLSTLYIVPELRAELHLLRSEMECWVGELRHEMEARLDSQRRHMVQKEGLLMGHITELKGELCRASQEVALLRRDLERARQESHEPLALRAALPPASLSAALTLSTSASPASAALTVPAPSSSSSPVVAMSPLSSSASAPSLAGRMAALSRSAPVHGGNVKRRQQDIAVV
ncbi:E3 ubiquitin-protein ligase NRDP1-like isoform X2 [Petromyzon marinus]|nr:E3 ubiquitin-protein ligase NRDP1-like isoform X2 [Petromyzon marinus]